MNMLQVQWSPGLLGEEFHSILVFFLTFSFFCIDSLSSLLVILFKKKKPLVADSTFCKLC